MITWSDRLTEKNAIGIGCGELVVDIRDWTDEFKSTLRGNDDCGDNGTWGWGWFGGDAANGV